SQCSKRIFARRHSRAGGSRSIELLLNLDWSARTLLPEATPRLLPHLGLLHPTTYGPRVLSPKAVTLSRVYPRSGAILRHRTAAKLAPQPSRTLLGNPDSALVLGGVPAGQARDLDDRARVRCVDEQVVAD